MKMNWSEVKEAKEYGPLPDGVYPAVVAEVTQEVATKTGNEYWNMKLEITSHEERFVWDSIHFTEKGKSRAKLIFTRLGIVLTDDIDLQPEMLTGKKCGLDLESERYQANDGSFKSKNKVTYAGYKKEVPAEPIIHQGLSTQRPAQDPPANVIGNFDPNPPEDQKNKKPPF